MFSRIYTRSASKSAMERIKRLHFVGVGGVGMSGIAEVFVNLGFEVSGSDLSSNPATQRLIERGARIELGHDAQHVQDADVVVISSAVDDSNPEVAHAKEMRIPIVPRAAMLAELMRFRFGIAVAGTHGKTTTTSLVASLLAEGELDPTYIIGGRLTSSGSNAKLGTGNYLVAEADESDASFLCLQPMVSIVTNIDEDHMSTYHGDFAHLRQTFLDFLHHLPFYGLAVMCIDDDNVRNLLDEIERPFLSYGLSEDADFRAHSLEHNGLVTQFSVDKGDEKNWLDVSLNLPGEHNVQNALAAIAVADELGVSKEAICTGLQSFQGIGRRFQMHGNLSVDGKNVMLVDDYGHHPREVAATLDAIRAGWPQRRVVLIFQPHRFSRTRDLFEDFVNVLSAPDALLLLEVYAAGETPIHGADGRALMRAIRLVDRNEPLFVESRDNLSELLPGMLQDGDILVTMGAGDVGRIPTTLHDLWGRGDEA
jgi:UDP-N-acetylmuramate--alanine ligase